MEGRKRIDGIAILTETNQKLNYVATVTQSFIILYSCDDYEIWQLHDQKKKKQKDKYLTKCRPNDITKNAPNIKSVILMDGDADDSSHNNSSHNNSSCNRESITGAVADGIINELEQIGKLTKADSTPTETKKEFILDCDEDESVKSSDSESTDISSSIGESSESSESSESAEVFMNGYEKRFKHNWCDFCAAKLFIHEMAGIDRVNKIIKRYEPETNENFFEQSSKAAHELGSLMAISDDIRYHVMSEYPELYKQYMFGMEMNMPISEYVASSIIHDFNRRVLSIYAIDINDKIGVQAYQAANSITCSKCKMMACPFHERYSFFDMGEEKCGWCGEEDSVIFSASYDESASETEMPDDEIN